MKSFLVALGFLTANPVRTGAPAPGELGRSGMCFPLVGLVLGVALVAAQDALVELFPPLLTATLVVALWAALTGGLHLDGLADCADGLLVTATRERRLEILRDPRAGAFGVVGLTLFLLLKVHTVGALLGVDGEPPRSSDDWLQGGWLATFHHVAPLLTSSVLARWVILIVARQPCARTGGWAADFSGGLSLPVLGAAVVLPIALLGAAIALGDWTIVLGAAVAHVVALGVVVLARARLGGITGDVLGLTVELVELSVLLTFVARAVRSEDTVV